MISDLKANGYPVEFIEKACKEREGDARSEISEGPTAFASIPYVKGVSERVRRILGRENVKTAFRPVKTLGDVFRKPKERPHENQVTGIVYKVECKSCPFVYIGESKRSWNSRGAEHKPGTRGNNESAIKQHAETTGHDIHPNYVEILERGVGSRNKRLFLESLHSTVNTEAVNERQPFPKAYLPLIVSLRDCHKF